MPADPLEAVYPEPLEPAAHLQGKKIVVVEDEGMIQLQLHRVLQSYGAQVVGAARSGPEGVAIVLALRPDLVLLDINLPEGFDGLEAVRRIQQTYRPRIILISGYSDEERREQARLLEVDAFLTKPVSAASLVPQMEAVLQQ